MDEREGVIKFELDFTPGAALTNEPLKELNAWRRVFYQLGLIGQDSHRYGGLGFGNISCRYIDEKNHKRGNAFLITGSQTAHLDKLEASHYVLVLKCNVAANQVTAQGPIKPSSESLTHGAVYESDAGVNAVVHVHCPEIWNNVAKLKAPFTNSSTRYGTPEMAKAIQHLLSNNGPGSGVIVMKGHTDGVLSYGASLAQAGISLISLYQKALLYWA